MKKNKYDIPDEVLAQNVVDFAEEQTGMKVPKESISNYQLVETSPNNFNPMPIKSGLSVEQKEAIKEELTRLIQMQRGKTVNIDAEVENIVRIVSGEGKDQ